ncbi:MAG: ribosomal protein [Cyanobacteria bacterium RYN_339]|nr:ribosomal protein [Cyanobacteria bacterium RYN_339]
MAIEIPKFPLSYEDYAAIDDDERYEVLEGELIPMGPAPFLRHQHVAGRIFRALGNHVDATGIGQVFIAPVDVVLRAERPATVLQPDVLYFGPQSLERLTRANVQGPPDIVVEVLSPSNARKDAVRKLGLYQKFGVPEYWIVPEHTDRIEVLRLDDDGNYARPQLYLPGEVLRTPMIPGFELDVAKIFPPND